MKKRCYKPVPHFTICKKNHSPSLRSSRHKKLPDGLDNVWHKRHNFLFVSLSIQGEDFTNFTLKKITNWNNMRRCYPRFRKLTLRLSIIVGSPPLDSWILAGIAANCKKPSTQRLRLSSKYSGRSWELNERNDRVIRLRISSHCPLELASIASSCAMYVTIFSKRSVSGCWT